MKHTEREFYTSFGAYTTFCDTFYRVIHSRFLNKYNGVNFYFFLYISSQYVLLTMKQTEREFYTSFGAYTTFCDTFYRVIHVGKA
jgi:hypothetical protein